MSRVDISSAQVAGALLAVETARITSAAAREDSLTSDPAKPPAPLPKPSSLFADLADDPLDLVEVVLAMRRRRARSRTTWKPGATGGDPERIRVVSTEPRRPRSPTLRRLGAVILIASLLGGSTIARAGDAQPALSQSDLEGRVRFLEEEVRRLRRERDAAQPAGVTAAPAPSEEGEPLDSSAVEAIVDYKLKKQKVLAGWQDGFFLQSPSGDFKLKLRGYAQADARFFPFDEGDTGTDSFFLRRVRPIFEGTVYKHFGVRIMPDFGLGTTTLQDGYLDVTYFPWLSLRAGKFKEPFSLERLQSGAELLFIERSIAQNLAPNRDVGVQLFGDLAGGVFGYQLGIFNGVFDGGSNDEDRNSDKDFAGRVFVHPFKTTGWAPLQALGFGVAGTYGNRTDDNSGVNFRTAGRSSFYRYVTAANVAGLGNQWRIGPQGYWFWGPFGVMGEYFHSESGVKGTVSTGDAATTVSADEESSGWFAQASWVLTGEDASYKTVTPINNFDPRNGRWGAFELAGRVSNINLEDDAIVAKLASGTDEAWAYTAGLNWYFNKAFKVQFNYERTDFDGKPTFAGQKRDHEDVFLTRFQIAY